LRGEGRQAAAAGTESTNPLLAGVPADALDKFRKGEEKLRRSDFKGAAALFDEATRSHPAFAAAYYEKGQAQLKDNDMDGALGSFVKAVQAKQDYLEAKYSVGYTQFLRKNYEVAAAVFDDVLKQKRDMPEAHMYLGISLYHLKNVEAAEAALRSAIAAHDGENVALAHRFLGGIYLQKKRNSEAAAELERYLELVPKAPDAGRLKETIAGLKKSS
jgi:tetratricopeptide (TPR) repeat protein